MCATSTEASLHRFESRDEKVQLRQQWCSEGESIVLMYVWLTICSCGLLLLLLDRTSLTTPDDKACLCVCTIWSLYVIRFALLTAETDLPCLWVRKQSNPKGHCLTLSSHHHHYLHLHFFLHLLVSRHLLIFGRLHQSQQPLLFILRFFAWISLHWDALTCAVLMLWCRSCFGCSSLQRLNAISAGQQHQLDQIFTNILITLLCH